MTDTTNDMGARQFSEIYVDCTTEKHIENLQNHIVHLEKENKVLQNESLLYKKTLPLYIKNRHRVVELEILVKQLEGYKRDYTEVAHERDHWRKAYHEGVVEFEVYKHQHQE